ncbi:MAG: tetratricopeptide repeat protein [Deltaproteobacteria bacterium]|nr:tetratricopeptide repeat protein [Deltaproteobacteria bacterium]
MTQDCKRFESFLLDLAYGELPEDTAEELRMHAAECQGCREALEDVMLTRKMAAQLPPLEPEVHLDSAILDAARDAADTFSRAAQPQVVPQKIEARSPASSAERLPSLVERLRALMLTPALATAAVATLVFAITFFLAEKAPNRDGQPNLALLNQATEHAEPLGEAELNERVEEATQAAVHAEKKVLQDPTPTRDFDKTTRSHEAIGGNLGTAGPAPAKPRGGKSAPAATAARQASKSRKRSKMYSGFEREEQALDDVELEAAPAPKSEYFQEDSFPGAKSSASDVPPSQVDEDYRLGMAAYARGDCNSATAVLLRVAELRRPHPSKTPLAMHHIARCEKRRGRFGKALPWYEKLVGRFPRYSGKAEALLEMATCHRRLGHIDKARARLKELSRIPGWGNQAAQELERLDQ